MHWRLFVGTSVHQGFTAGASLLLTAGAKTALTAGARRENIISGNHFFTGNSIVDPVCVFLFLSGRVLLRHFIKHNQNYTFQSVFEKPLYCFFQSGKSKCRIHSGMVFRLWIGKLFVMADCRSYFSLHTPFWWWLIIMTHIISKHARMVKSKKWKPAWRGLCSVGYIWAGPAMIG